MNSKIVFLPWLQSLCLPAMDWLMVLTQNGWTYIHLEKQSKTLKSVLCRGKTWMTRMSILSVLVCLFVIGLTNAWRHTSSDGSKWTESQGPRGTRTQWTKRKHLFLYCHKIFNKLDSFLVASLSISHFRWKGWQVQFYDTQFLLVSVINVLAKQLESPVFGRVSTFIDDCEAIDSERHWIWEGVFQGYHSCSWLIHFVTCFQLWWRWAWNAKW